MAIAISYLDRQALPVAIKAVEKDIPISNQVMASLNSAFLIAYGLMYLGGGKLMDVLGTRLGFALIMVFWSLAQLSQLSLEFHRNEKSFGAKSYAMNAGFSKNGESGL